jgi:hypothetical protein
LARARARRHHEPAVVLPVAEGAQLDLLLGQVKLVGAPGLRTAAD